MTTENKYQVLDDAICWHIKYSLGHPSASSSLAAIARQLLASNKTPFPVAWRLIDRRLQVMRKNGRIVYEHTKGVGRRRWRVTDAAL